MSVTHPSYEAAHKALKGYKRQGRTTSVSWEIGGGWWAEAFFCPRLNRVVTASCNPEGFRIV